MKFLSENEELKDFSKISAAECPSKHDNARLIECRFGFLKPFAAFIREPNLRCI